MYNELEKACFIAENLVSNDLRNYAIDLFSKTEEYENIYKKDIAQMSADEASQIVGNLGLKSLGTLYYIRSLVRSYIKWCSSNNMFDNISDGFLKAIDPDSNFLSTSPWFKDINDLISSMMKIHKFDEGFPEPVIMCCAWIGISKEMTYGLLDSQVDIDGKTISNIDGSIAKTWESDKISEIFKEYVDCKIAFRDNSSCSYKVGKDVSSKYFLKKFCSFSSPKFGTPFTKVQLDSALNRFSEKNKELGMPDRMKYTNVWESGRLYELWEMEQAGFVLTSEENQSKIVNVFNNTKSSRSILWSYKEYKRIFKL